MFRNKTLSYLFLLIVLFTSSKTTCLAEEGPLYMARMNVCNLIEAGKFNEAKSATNSLISDFSGNSGMPEALYWIGERYERFDKFGDAKQNYQHITANYPNSPWANKANLGVPRATIKSLIASEDFQQAEGAIDKFISDFSGNPDLPGAIFWITERYQRLDRFAEARKNYQRIIQNYPQSPYAKNAKLLLARIDILSLIASQNFEDANDAIDTLTSDFAEHADLPETLYWIAERYERLSRFDEANRIYHKLSQNFPDSHWRDKAKFRLSKVTILSLIELQNYDGAKVEFDKFAANFSSNPEYSEALYWIAERYERYGRFDEANRIYLQLSQNVPTSSWGDKSKIGVARANVLNLIVSEKYDLAKEALDKLISDFPGHPRLPAALYWIAERYERNCKYEEANKLYRQIGKNYSDTPFYAERARFDIRQTDIYILLDANEFNEVEVQIDKFIADFKDDPCLPDAIFQFGGIYYVRASELKKQGKTDKTEMYLNKALDVWKRLLEELPPHSNVTPDTLFYSGVCYSEIGRKENAANCFRKVADEWPDYIFAREARLMAEYGFKNVSIIKR